MEIWQAVVVLPPTRRIVSYCRINIFQAAVPVKSSILSLGVTLDSCLTWSKHVDAVVGKCVGMLIRLRHFAI